MGRLEEGTAQRGNIVEGGTTMQLRDERGMMAIGVALMLIVVLSLFSVALWQYGMLEMRRVQRTEEDTQALFLARAGAEAVMGAWKNRMAEAAGGKKEYAVPFGQMDPLYYDLDNKRLTPDKPVNSLGKAEVVVRLERATEDRDDYVTVIESTATVGSTTRTVKLVSYPHRYGHDGTLGWYYPSNSGGQTAGAIRLSEYIPRPEVVVMKTDNQTDAIFLGSSALTTMATNNIKNYTWTASALIFDSPLRLIKNADDLFDGPKGSVDLTLAAEMVYLNGLDVVSIRKGSPVHREYPSKDFSIVLSLPSFGSEAGFSGNDIRDKVDNSYRNAVVSNARYGEVYFYGGSVRWVEYEYFKDYIWIFIPFTNIRVKQRTELNQLNGRGFYFRDGWRLIPTNINDVTGFNIAKYIQDSMNTGWILPIKEEFQTRREDLENLRPFYWER
jgi:hypothetical protein